MFGRATRSEQRRNDSRAVALTAFWIQVDFPLVWMTCGWLTVRELAGMAQPWAGRGRLRWLLVGRAVIVTYRAARQPSP